MTKNEAIKLLCNGEYSLYNDNDNIKLLNEILSTCFPNKETRIVYIDKWFCGNQIEKRWIGRVNNSYTVPFIKLSEIKHNDINTIIENKKKGIDCSEEESAEIKGILRNIFELFPLEHQEVSLEQIDKHLTLETTTAILEIINNK